MPPAGVQAPRAPLANAYTLKMATREAPCFVCNRFCTSVLQNSVDWFFACQAHLQDPAFCRSTAPVEPVAAPSAPDAKQPGKTNDKQPEKANDKKAEKPGDQQKDTDDATVKTPPPREPARPKSPPTYILDRRIFYLRQQRVAERAAPKTPRVFSMPSVPMEPPHD